MVSLYTAFLLLHAVPAFLPIQAGAPAAEEPALEPLTALTQRLEKAARSGEAALEPLVRAEAARVPRALHPLLLRYLEARAAGDRKEGERLLTAARAVAAAFRAATGNRVLEERCERYAAFTPEALAARRRVTELAGTAARAYAEGRAETAGARLAEALALCRKIGDRWTEGQLLLSKAKADSRRGRKKEALKAVEEVRAIFTAQADAVGVCKTWLVEAWVGFLGGEGAAAFEALERAERLAGAVPDPELRSDVYSTAGALYHRCGRVTEAVAAFKKAVRLSRSLGSRTGEAQNLNNLGAACIEAARYQEAAAALHRSAELFDALGRPLLAAQAQANLGTVYFTLGDLDRARNVFRRLEQRFEEGGFQWDSMRATVLLNLAACRDRKGDKEGARAAYEEVLPLWRELGDRPGEAWTLEELGVLRIASRGSEEARDSLDAALELYRALGDRLGECRIHRHRAALEEKGGRMKEAVAWLERALALARETGAADMEAELLFDRGRMESAAGEDLRALDTFEEGFALLAAAGREITVPSLEMGLETRVEGALEDALCAFGRVRGKAPAAADPWRAFTWVEEWRSRALLDALGAERSWLFRGVDADARKEETPLLREMARAVHEGWDPELTRDQRKAARGRLRKLRDALAERRERRAVKAPGYAAAAAPVLPPLEDLQRTLGSGTLLLAYKLAREHSFLFALTDRSFALFLLPPRAEVERKAAYALEILSNPDPEAVPLSEAAEVLHELFRVIVAPALEAEGVFRDEIVVVPDGVLARLPFEVLLDQPWKGGGGGYADFPYLLRRAAIRYAPSAAVMYRLRAGRGKHEGREGKAARTAVLALADPEPVPAPFRDRPLPAARGEVEALARAFDRVDRYEGAAAVEGVLKRPGGLDGHDLVHIASHGWTDTAAPGLSGLVLAPDPDGTEDGLLLMVEVLGLRVTADLVTLSACRSGRGRFAPGEGVVGLPWAFLRAGARSVLVSLWDVDDEAAAALMARFYENLGLERMGKAAALRAAKLALIKEGYARPFRFAPFVLVGHGGALRSKDHW